jgi:hypothetical protein
LFDGTREFQKSPLAQNRSKVAFLKNQLPPFWPVGDTGVFAAENVEIDPILPLNLIRVAGLSQWLRPERQKFGSKRPVDVRRAKDGVLKYSDLTPVLLNAIKSAYGARHEIDLFISRFLQLLS